MGVSAPAGVRRLGLFHERYIPIDKGCGERLRMLVPRSSRRILYLRKVANLYLDKVRLLGLKNMDIDILSLIKSIRKSYYSEYMRVCYGVDIPSTMDYSTSLQTVHSLCRLYGEDKIDKLFKRANLDSQIICRLRSRIELMLNLGDCIFLTFTFTDDSLLRYSTDYLRLCVKRFLNLYSALYIANVDYGKENGRIHYHAVALTGHVNFKAWKFGAINAQRIHSTEDSLCLARYVSKLSNHSIKESTRRESLIYSRGFVEIEKKLKNFQKDIDK